MIKYVEEMYLWLCTYIYIFCFCFCSFFLLLFFCTFYPVAGVTVFLVCWSAVSCGTRGVGGVVLFVL
jgi:hypothetical protein